MGIKGGYTNLWCGNTESSFGIIEPKNKKTTAINSSDNF
jgi:hypothetical protein